MAQRLYCIHCLEPKQGSSCCGDDQFETWDGSIVDDEGLDVHELMDIDYPTIDEE